MEEIMRYRIESDPYVRRPTYVNPTSDMAMGNIQKEIPKSITYGAIGEKGVAHTFHEAFRQLREFRTTGRISKKEFNDRKEELRQYRDVAIEIIPDFKGTGGIK